MEGVDFSWGRPGADALVAAKKKFVIRYITGSGKKALTEEEIVEYRNAGLAIVLIFESTAGRALDGRQAGIADATTANMRALALGFPATQPIYFAVDVNTTPINYPVISNYFSGVATAIARSRVGVYGEYDLLAFLLKNRLVTYLWQTHAWSHGLVHDSAHIYQYRNGQQINGAAVDLDRSLRPDYGQWVPPLAPPDTSTGVTMSFLVPKVPTVIQINQNGMLYVNADLVDGPGAIKVFPSREMPLHGMTADYYIVEYVNENGVHSGKAYFVKKSDTLLPYPVPPAKPVELPATYDNCKVYADDAVAAERLRIRKLLGV